MLPLFTSLSRVIGRVTVSLRPVASLPMECVYYRAINRGLFLLRVRKFELIFVGSVTSSLHARHMAYITVVDVLIVMSLELCYV